LNNPPCVVKAFSHGRAFLTLPTKYIFMETNTTGKSEKTTQTEDYAKPPFNEKSQALPGSEKKMNIRPDHGENSYRGHNKLKGLKAIITGGDSGIGKAVAIAFAREGADVLISYLNAWSKKHSLSSKRLIL
jgi:hypothetical protein